MSEWRDYSEAEIVGSHRTSPRGIWYANGYRMQKRSVEHSRHGRFTDRRVLDPQGKVVPGPGRFAASHLLKIEELGLRAERAHHAS